LQKNQEECIKLYTNKKVKEYALAFFTKEGKETLKTRRRKRKKKRQCRVLYKYENVNQKRPQGEMIDFFRREQHE